ncbi:aldo/keto reductase [Candidatus Woesearchaeota archaeon]|nr:aldo/keto reductase [Candidatus Woesearchaeota archaeon]
MDISSTVRLNDSNRMPWLGLGTWRSPPGKATEQAVLWALEAGYRHIDTAAIYGNEQSVGAAVQKRGIPREEIFITTKLWNADHSNPGKALRQSLSKLGMSYVDLYLIHFPVRQRLSSWQVLEQLQKDGLCRSIGVSNFTIRHMKELLPSARVIPAVNQVEFNPYLYQRELHEFCTKNKVWLEAYSPLAQGEKLKDPKLVSLAAKYSRSPSQLLIRWCLQKEVVVIPKSVHREFIFQNADVFSFSITKEDMVLLDSFDENLRLCWDPTVAP